MGKYTFRIKPGSPLEQELDNVLENCPDGVSKKALRSTGTMKKYADALGVLGDNADNFTFGIGGVSFTDVVPQTVIQQAEQVIAPHVASAPEQDYDGPSVRWPDTPIINDTSDYPWFRKAGWYSRMELMVKLGKHISLAGPPGIGKSSAVEYMAAEQGKVLVNVSADAGLRRRDLTGNVELVNSHTQFMVSEYLAAVRNGWWVKIDEVNAAEPDALMYLNSQIAPPHSASFYGQTVQVHPDFRLFVTYNPGLVGTKPLPESLKDRFFPIKLQFPKESALRRMLEANGMPSVNKSMNPWQESIVDYGLECWKQFELGRMRYQITPRRLMDAITLVMEAQIDVYDALEAAVIMAVDNVSDARVLKDVLKKQMQAFQFGRM